MKRKMLTIAIFSFMMFVSVSAQAAASITASYQVLSQQATATGTTINIELILKNTGTTSLANIAMNLVDPMLSPNPDSNFFGTDAVVAAGGTVGIGWTISTIAPGLVPGTPLQIEVIGLDDSGQRVSFQITASEEVVQ